ncbi:MAG: EF-hand domain-containing protein [Verrucomicrobiota bacterium]
MNLKPGSGYKLSNFFQTAVLLAFACIFVFPSKAQERPDPWERMKTRDADQDGRVSRQEFPGLPAMFDRMDANRDGFLSEEEVSKFRGPGASGNRPEAGRPGPGFPGLMQRLDQDQDGKISENEWTQFFKNADANRDRVLDQDEWQSGMREGGGKDSAPAVGSKAPKVKAKTLRGDRTVNLAKPKRMTVLIFGSYT